jgi:hypothetical protein
MIDQKNKISDNLTLKMKALQSFETSGSTDPTAERKIPEDFSVQIRYFIH